MDIEQILDELEEGVAPFVDGTVDPGDLDILKEKVNFVWEWIEKGIQSMIDSPGERKNVMYVMAIIQAGRMAIFWKKLLGK